MELVKIEKLLPGLAIKRPIFHSEADFQHSLAWEIHQQWTTCSMRLEFKPPHLENRFYLDIWVAQKDMILAIELKYKTRKLHAKVQNESFELLDQSAQDVSRYDFLKDIQRLEQIVSGRKDIIGYAILLTNDSSYWNPPINDRSIDSNFRIHQGRNLTGALRWGTRASIGTVRGREEEIHIKGEYKLDWRDYSNPSKESYGKFRYLLVRVGYES